MKNEMVRVDGGGMRGEIRVVDGWMEENNGTVSGGGKKSRLSRGAIFSRALLRIEPQKKKLEMKKCAWSFWILSRLFVDV